MPESKSSRIIVTKIATFLMATFTVYFAIFAIPTYPLGVEYVWDGSSVSYWYAIMAILNIAIIFCLMAYFGRQKSLPALNENPNKIEKFIEDVKKSREEGTWSRAMIGFIFLSMGFMTMGLDWESPYYFICFFMGIFGLSFGVWHQYDSYINFLKKIKKILPFLGRFVNRYS